MNPLTREWIEKAEGDFNTAQRELGVDVKPNYDAVCFHAQQTAEKYLKAVLQENSYQFPRTHILADLLALCLNIDPSFKVLQHDVNVLEGYAVQFRYPGLTAEKLEAAAAIQAVTSIRTFARKFLGTDK